MGMGMGVWVQKRKYMADKYVWAVKLLIPSQVSTSTRSCDCRIARAIQKKTKQNREKEHQQSTM